MRVATDGDEGADVVDNDVSGEEGNLMVLVVVGDDEQRVLVAVGILEQND